MNHFKIQKINLFSIIILLLFLFFFVQNNAQASNLSEETIVRYQDITSLKNDIKIIAKQYNLDIKILDIIKDNHIAKISSINFSQKELRDALLNLNSTYIVEKNQIRTGSFVPNDSFYSRQWAHKNVGQTVNGVGGKLHSDINSEVAWDSETEDTDVIVAIVDSGVDYKNSDLVGNMWDGSTKCVDNNGNDIAGKCPFHGWNYVDNNNNPDDVNHPTEEYNGHGTFVASQLASVTNNAHGISGMSVRNNIKIMAIKFNFDTFSEIKAINFAKNNGAKIINASFGGAGYSQIEKDAIDNFGGTFIAAAGNGGEDSVGDYIDVNKFFPCGYESSNILCVGASNSYDEIASFSNYGTKSVDIVAPGVNLYGLYRGNFTYGNGTSFATPLVSGTVALLYNKNNLLTPIEIINDIKNSGTYISSLKSKIASSRRLNTGNAIRFVTDLSKSKVVTNDKIPIFRLYNTRTKAQLYTIGVADRDKILSKYPEFEFTDGSPAFYANISDDGTTPIYRLYNTRTGAQLYTIGVADRDKILAKWHDFEFTDGSPAFYASTSLVSS